MYSIAPSTMLVKGPRESDRNAVVVGAIGYKSRLAIDKEAISGIIIKKLYPI